MAADEVKRSRTGPREGVTAREGATAREGTEDDVEGHSMLPNMGLARPIAQARERDIQAHLRRHDLEADARAHKKGR